MRQRTRIGIRIGGWLFPHAATFVVKVKDFDALHQRVQDLKDALYASGDPKATELADRLFCEKA